MHSVGLCLVGVVMLWSLKEAMLSKENCAYTCRCTLKNVWIVYIKCKRGAIPKPNTNY